MDVNPELLAAGLAGLAFLAFLFAVAALVRRRRSEGGAEVEAGPRAAAAEPKRRLPSGLGPLVPLLEDPTISEIMVNSPELVFVERKGRVERVEARFQDEAHLVEVIRRLIAPARRRVDLSSPMVDARLEDGSRVNAVLYPLATQGSSLTIRKFHHAAPDLAALVGFGSLDERLAAWLRQAVRDRRNVCVSGGTGTGKTTLLNALSAEIAREERIITIEDAAELKLAHPNVVSLESRPSNLEGAGGIGIRQLFTNALRMRPDRLIVGECRGGEALDMLQAMNTGHDGSLTTVHANTPRDAVNRLETLVYLAGFNLPSRAVRQQIASAIHVIVHTERLADGRRVIGSVATVEGVVDGEVLVRERFRFRPPGPEEEGGRGAFEALD
jgi:pilus assembly protein CpaF